jgi:hypothetical protein
MFHAFAFQMSFTNTYGDIFYKYECAYGPNGHCNDSNHARLIKQGCLVAFSIKHMAQCDGAMLLPLKMHPRK